MLMVGWLIYLIQHISRYFMLRWYVHA
jgi:hypothetical protein